MRRRRYMSVLRRERLIGSVSGLHRQGSERELARLIAVVGVQAHHAVVGSQAVGQQIVRKLGRGAEQFGPLAKVTNRLTLDLGLAVAAIPMTQVVRLVDENENSGRPLP